MACSATRTMSQSLNSTTHPFFSQQSKAAQEATNELPKHVSPQLQQDGSQYMSDANRQQWKLADSSGHADSVLEYGSVPFHQRNASNTLQPSESGAPAKRFPGSLPGSFGEVSKDGAKPRQRRKRKLNSQSSSSLVSWIDKSGLEEQCHNRSLDILQDRAEGQQASEETLEISNGDSQEHPKSTDEPPMHFSMRGVASAEIRPSQTTIETLTETQQQNSKPKLTSDERVSSVLKTHKDPNSQSRSIKDVLKDGPMRGRHKKLKSSLITICQYGQNDLKHREQTGKQIRDILEGKTRVENPRSGEAPPRAVSGLNTSKPLHPFFNAQHIPIENSSTLPKTERQASLHSSQRLTQSPTKSFSTPRRPIPRSLFAKQQNPALETPAYTHYLSQKFRLPGTHDPPWPCQNFSTMPNKEAPYCRSSSPGPPLKHSHARKDKQLKFRIPQESSLVQRFTELLVPTMKAQAENNTRHRPDSCASRTIMTGLELKHSIAKRLPAELVKMMETPEKTGTHAHPAISRLWYKLDDILSQFDRVERESIPWANKYCPTFAEEVLQDSKIMLKIKSWLEGQTVGAFDASTIHKPGTKQQQQQQQTSRGQRHRKKRKISAEMDNFLVSSDEEFEEMREMGEDEVSTLFGQSGSLRSLIREPIAADATSAFRHANTVLFSGPHGAGKTACAYAVAKELGFEIFEINAGSRRSGKDILEKVGDMSLNHQVHKSHFEQRERDVNSSTLEATPPPESFPTQSNKLTSFFQSSSNKQSTKTHGKYRERSRESRQKRVSQRASAGGQMQSVILIEEVDILFDEDKQFWDAIQELAIRSRRPIIMTCNDENLVPTQGLSLHAIIRFQRPPSQLAAAYLLLVAAAEGHLLSMETTKALFEATRQDLRAALTNLQFFCQMGIGDLSNGLNWLLKRWPPGVDQDLEGRIKRVISERTLGPLQTLPGYEEGNNDGRPNESQEEFIQHLSEEWLLDSLDLASFNLSSPVEPALDVSSEVNALPRKSSLSLEDYDSALSYLSAADAICKAGFPRAWSNSNKLDSEQPLNLERPNYTQGHQILQADHQIDYCQLPQKIAAYVSVGITRRFKASMDANPKFSDKTTSLEISPRETFELFNPGAQGAEDKAAAQYGFESADMLRDRMKRYRQELSATLDPLAYSSICQPNPIGTLDLTCLDRQESVVSSEVAPYVRSIVAHDKQLFELHSDNTTENNSKRRRTTRASRSALLGSKRDVTRRERWLPEDLDYDRVLKTGCPAWPVNAYSDQAYESGSHQEGGNESDMTVDA